MESQRETPVKLRFAWEVLDERTLTWNEMSVAGGPWLLIETYALTPSG